MSDEATPQAEPVQAPVEPAPQAAAPQPEPQQALQLEPPAPAPGIESDPAVRAAIERARSEAVEAERQRLAEREEQIRTEAAQAAEERVRAEAEEAKRVAEMSATERLQHELAQRDAALAERDQKIAAAEAKAAESDKRLSVTQALSAAGLRLAARGDGSPDEALQRVAFERIAEKTASGITVAEAVAELHKTDPALFAKPAVAEQLTSTNAGQAAPRGSVSTARAPSAGGEFNALKMSRQEFNDFRGRRGWLEYVHEQPKPNIH